MHESPCEMIIDREVKDSLYTEENTIIPNENWSQFKKSIEAEGPNTNHLDAATYDIEMVDEEDESECWTQSYQNTGNDKRNL